MQDAPGGEKQPPLDASIETVEIPVVQVMMVREKPSYKEGEPGLEVLMVRRRGGNLPGALVFPGKKLQAGEDPKQAALDALKRDVWTHMQDQSQLQTFPNELYPLGDVRSVPQTVRLEDGKEVKRQYVFKVFWLESLGIPLTNTYKGKFDDIEFMTPKEILAREEGGLNTVRESMADADNIPDSLPRPMRELVVELSKHSHIDRPPDESPDAQPSLVSQVMRAIGSRAYL